MDNQSFFSGKTVVIAGGTGFIGSHVVSRLKPLVRRIYIPSRSHGSDFRSYDTCRNYLSKTKPDILINLAANQGGIDYPTGQEVDIFMDNFLMNIHLLRASNECTIPVVVNVLPGCIYPGYLKRPVLAESDLWDGTLHDSVTAYGWSRKISIILGSLLMKRSPTTIVHCILANVYGPGDHFHPKKSKALPAIMLALHRAKRTCASSVTLWGTGKPIRDWLYVEDAAEAICIATAKYRKKDPINIATGHGISIRELAHEINHVVGFTGTITFNRTKPEGAAQKILDNTRMKQILGWQPQTPLTQGIVQTYAWFQMHQKEAVAL